MPGVETFDSVNPKPAPMPAAELRKILRYNQESGGLTWAVARGCNFNRRKVDAPAGTLASNGYVVIKINRVLYKAHRLAWYLATGVWPIPPLMVDHINGVKGDNRLANLRLTTRDQNSRNLVRRFDRLETKVAEAIGPRKYGRGEVRPAPMPIDKLRLLLAYDREAGTLIWKNCPVSGQGAKRMKAGTTAGCISVFGYVVVGISKRLYPAHRLAWYLETGDWPLHQIDHINEIKSDNRWCNLRLATHAQNQINRASSRPNTSGYRGVGRFRSGWRAQINVAGKHLNFPMRATAAEAFADYCAAARHFHGEFARFD